MDQLAAFFREDPLRIEQAERMIRRLREQGVGFAYHDDYESPYVAYAGLLPYDSPLIRPIRKLCLDGVNVYLPVRRGHGTRDPTYFPTEPKEVLRYPGLPWWNSGAGRLYPLEKIYYYHTLKEAEEDHEARSLTIPFDLFTI